MKYDFETYYDRTVNSSWKWLAMHKQNEQPKTDVIPMTVADMDFPTCPKIVAGLKTYLDTQVLGYSDPTEAYLNAVKTFFEREHDYSIETEWVVTSAGIVPALANSVKSFTEVGEGVIIFTPVYKPFYDVIENQHRRIEECPLLLENNRYEIDFELLASLASKEDVRLLMLCSPHNPGGRVWTKAELTKIAEIVIQHNLIIVSDEIHSDIMLTASKHTIFSAIDERVKERSIVCTAASKTFNIAGLQCSNIFIPSAKLRTRFKEQNLASGVQAPNVLGMVATQLAYTECQDWLEEVRQVVKTNQDLVTEFFNEWHPSWKVMKQDSSFLPWIDFSEFGINAKDFTEFLATDCDFYVNEGSMFGKQSENFMRINIGLPTKKLSENLHRLKAVAERTDFFS